MRKALAMEEIDFSKIGETEKEAVFNAIAAEKGMTIMFTFVGIDKR